MSRPNIRIDEYYQKRYHVRLAKNQVTKQELFADDDDLPALPDGQAYLLGTTSVLLNVYLVGNTPSVTNAFLIGSV